MMKLIAMGICVATALFATAQAEVKTKSETGFTIAIEFRLNATPDETWAALTEPSTWWNKDHSWSGDAANFSLDPVAGGCFCERWNGNEVKHMEIATAMQGKRLVMRGALGPLQGLGVTGALSWIIQPDEEDETKTMLTVNYNVGGYADMDAWSGPVDGVIVEQAARLARLVNTGTPEPDLTTRQEPARD
ncbi:ATPase [Parvularcula flava]|uniref:ATPase n=1 Tax=Aquisalinus luteolus TaxID=1566827 RepID=A0A8J3A3A4_9PROT|nr:ATPase [Aquisalinus luteolus]NHK28620.1 ATPase [Aquisalinus luteolus]GGH99024.1 ATPase [Aquisalinus luteolus]